MGRVKYRPPVYDVMPWLPRGEEWRDEGMCGQHPMPWLWDSSLDGESETAKERAYRHSIAIAICKTCPVMDQCGKAIDTKLDEGVRAGVALPDKFAIRRHVA